MSDVPGENLPQVLGEEIIGLLKRAVERRGDPTLLISVKRPTDHNFVGSRILNVEVQIIIGGKAYPGDRAGIADESLLMHRLILTLSSLQRGLTHIGVLK